MTDIFEPRVPRSWIVLDLESAVLDEAGHRRYLNMERHVPRGDDRPSRRNYKRDEDPLKTPRWVFQTITTASLMVLTEHANGNVDVTSFSTLSAPEHNEREVVKGILRVLAGWPAAELITWSGMTHDCPMLVMACLKHGLSLPKGWGWLAFAGGNQPRHLDLARVITGGFKQKPIHLAEVLAAIDIPAKISAPAFSVAKHIYAGRWDVVKECCEGDVISTALLAARWKILTDNRIVADTVQDRIVRRVTEFMPERGYIAELRAWRARRMKVRFAEAANDAEVLAPWLNREVA